MTPPAAAPSETRNALIAGVACYMVWGFLPLLFMGMAASGFSSFEILAHRCLWSIPFAAGLVVLSGQVEQVKRVLTSPKILGWLALSTVMIVLNWGVYVWATTHQHTIEASLGYYINPLLNMVAGMVLFRERIDRWGWLAIALAAVGVALQTLALGRAPWLSIAVALTFSAYAVIRKRVAADAQTGLFVESLLMLPIGAGIMVWIAQSAPLVGFSSPAHWGWAVSSGLITVLPLALFAWSTRRLPLSIVGFIQFLAPTLQFAVGVASGEALTPLRIASFVFIWAGVVIFVLAILARRRAEQLSVQATVDAV